MSLIRFRLKKRNKASNNHKICLNCFSKNPFNLNFCHKCGHETFEPIRTEYFKEDNLDSEELEYKKCSTCGSDTLLYFNFCSTCGYVFKDLVVYEDPNDKPPFTFVIDYETFSDMQKSISRGMRIILPLLAAVALNIPSSQWVNFLISIKVPKEYIPLAIRIMKTILRMSKKL